MKVCPNCQTKYTDDTLKFCLQDGSPLESAAADDKTLVFDPESFANDKTVAENYAPDTQDQAQETVAFESHDTASNKKESDQKIQISISPDETVQRPRTLSADHSAPPGFAEPARKRGWGIVTGLIVFLLLIGLIGIGALAVFVGPDFLSGEANVNRNTNTVKRPLVKTLSDTDEVKVSASSTRKQDSGNRYEPALAFDGNSRTAWCEGEKGPGKGEWIAFDFDKEYKLKQLIIEPGYFKTTELWRKNNRLKVAILSFSDGTTKSVTFPNKMKQQKINTENIKTRSVMIKIQDYYPGSADRKDTLISEVKFVVE